MKKVLHISKYYYPFRGGTEQVARDCVNALQDEYEQEVICFGEGRDTITDEVDDIKVIHIGCFTKISSQSLSFSYGRILKTELESFKPDIIIFHYPNPFAAHFLLKYCNKKTKLIIYWHLDIVRQKFLKYFFIRQNKSLTNRANLLIATSPNYILGSQYLSSVRDKCIVIPNCINEERLSIDREIEKKAQEIRDNHKGKIICVAMGRHTKYKGFDRLIRVAHLLDDSFVFFLIGKGEETEFLKREAGKDRKINFLGVLGEKDLKAYMIAMDIFCFPSITKNEAFGLSLAEAMYYEKPAVTFTIPGSGVNYVCIGGEDGIEVPNGNIQDYTRALKELATNEQLRKEMGCAGRNRVLSMFMINQYNKSITKALNELFIQEGKII